MAVPFDRTAVGELDIGGEEEVGEKDEEGSRLGGCPLCEYPFGGFVWKTNI